MPLTILNLVPNLLHQRMCRFCLLMITITTIATLVAAFWNVHMTLDSARADRRVAIRYCWLVRIATIVVIAERAVRVHVMMMVFMMMMMVMTVMSRRITAESMSTELAVEVRAAAAATAAAQ